MNEQDKIFKEQWEKTIEKGRIRYSLIHGSTFGFAIFILVNLFYLKEQSLKETYFTSDAFEQMTTMVLAGILGYGTLKWWVNQKVYDKILDKEKSLQ
jgi:hypothetical protein